MSNETNAERLEIIRDKQLQMHALSTFDINWLIERVTELESRLSYMTYDRDKQAERAQELEESTTVHVIKRRNGKPTVIGWNGERYVYQSDSTARGGYRNAKRE